ncbi:hypothetical protein [Dongia rigui]|uniref:Uncharacterized protein n=1 Tax=Dongia rigui TaxID=940149 RepID=A0ABU5DZ09_9PROT|nr:hypothetical protein [Dongia rigui]MDY0872543.1 hypothetical protein [Dongia rigui]
MPPGATQKQVPTRSEGVLGEWRDGAFHFHTPESEQRWLVEAYRSGVHPENWQRGQVLDDKTRDIVLSGLGGATAPVYRGPDGQYRFANAETIEPADIRALRAKSFQGVKLQDLKGPEIPGEDVIATRFAAARAANDNAPAVAASAVAPVAPQAKAGLGRFAAMAEAQKNASHPSPQEALQAIDDGVRLLANGLTIGYADNVAAAGDALFGDGSFAEDYQKNLAEQNALSQAALERSGIAGALVQSAPQFIPGAGDAIGLGNDIKMYLEDPSQRTWKNYGLTALGALPFVPSVASSIKRVDDALEIAGKVEAKVGKVDDVPIQAIDPHETRFSQETVSYQKRRRGSDSYTYDDIANSMKQNGWHGEPIDVVRMPDGKLTTADNTRILAARSAGIQAQARVRDFDAKIGATDATRFKHGQPGNPTTWGEAVQRRINDQSGKFRTATPYGSGENPRLRYPKSPDKGALK